MRKLFNHPNNYFFFALLLLSALSLQAQSEAPTISTDMPTIIPPSPSVAALMKFEEVPVSNYTGIPNVSIPIYNTKTRGNSLDFSMSLNYHPNSAAVNEHASHTGLGWSLMAGGTISRTVRGYPDELNNGVRFGIYQDNLGSNSNLFYSSYINSNVGFILPLSYKYDTHEGGKFDTEHDLWQFNFMGHTGRFIIKKNNITGILEVFKLDNNLYKIELDYTFENINNNHNLKQYTINSFRITDTKGFKYLFDVKEMTVSSTSVKLEPISANSASKITLGINPLNYVSSFHLKNVKDINQTTLIEFNYENANENYRDVSYEFNRYSSEDQGDIDYIKGVLISQNISSGGGGSSNIPGLAGASGVDSGISNIINYEAVNSELSKYEPLSKINVFTRSVSTKKLSIINIVDYATIEFEYEQGREDTWFENPDLAIKLKNITIKKHQSLQDEFIQKLEFNYIYLENNMGTSSIPLKRLALHEIKTYASNNEDYQKQSFIYKQSSNYLQGLGEDIWGFFCVPKNYCTYSLNESSKDFVMVDMLERITNPTGGFIVFNYGSNTYSYNGDSLLTEEDFSSNEDNINMINSVYTFNVSDQISIDCVDLPTMTNGSNPDWGVEYEISVLSNTGENGEFGPIAGLFLKKNGETISALSSCISIFKGEVNDVFEICFNSLDIGVSPNYYAEVKVVRKNLKNSNLKEYVYGGGVRINSIEYYENEFEIIKTKNYNYNFPNTNKSSGSLAFKKPVFKYFKNRDVIIEHTCVNGSCALFNDNYTVETTSMSNLLAAKQTSGGFVGYKNVTVYETGHGKTEYTFISPIDEPETYELFNIDYPFIPTKEIDYKRGLQIKEKIFEENDLLIKEVENQFEIVDEVEAIVGLRLYSHTNCAGSFKFSNYLMYSQTISMCLGGTNSYLCNFICDSSLPWISHINLIDKFGRSELTQSITKEYSYLSGQTPQIMQTTKNFTYNPVNKQIASQTTLTNNGENIKNEFFYLNPNGDALNNRISEIEKIEAYRNNELSAVSEIDYAPFPNHPHGLPQKVKTSKENLAFEDKIIYNRYDTYGNPLEVQQPNGMRISYVWGYNHTQPVAKIENMAYSAIPANLITAIHSATTDSTLNLALSNLRSSPALANAMVTTYIYKPLVGVSKITDPKGDFITYEYDAFNRLKTVKDKDGKLLSENEYHYRTQQP